MNVKAEMLKLPNVPVWFEETPRRPALEQDVACDVAIVGAGYTGLWTAYYLLKTKPDLRITIIDREYIGFCASGRNGGWAQGCRAIWLMASMPGYTTRCTSSSRR